MPKITNQINPDKISFLNPVVNTNNPTFQIFLKDLNGRTLTLDVSGTDSVEKTKNLVEDRTGVPPNQQRLVCAGKQLEGNKTLGNFNIKKESTLHLLLRLNGGKGEHDVIEKFMQKHIVHGNVTGLVTRESKIGMLAGRFLINQNTNNKIVTAANKINFTPEYSDPSIQNFYKKTLVTESMQGGNCNEIANWTAMQLIEKTTEQWIYVCYLNGKFPLDPNEDLTIPNHPLSGTKDKLDHVMVITSPENITNISSIDPDKATVVDNWFDHLACSLSDYMASKHPYYNYKYSTNKSLALNATNFSIAFKYKATGKAFATNKAAVKTELVQLKNDLDSDQSLNYSINSEKYEFDIDDTRVQDVRSKENLENLLIESKKTNSHKEEVALFNEDALKEITKSTNDIVLGILFEALIYLPKKLNIFCTLVHQDLIKRLFSEQFMLFAFDDVLATLLNDTFSDSDTNKVKILNALSEAQLSYYAFSEKATLESLLSLNSIEAKLKKALKNDPNWENFWELCSESDINTILNKLINFDSTLSAVGIKALSKESFEDYILNHTSIGSVTAGGATGNIMQAIYTQLKAFGILTTNQIYKDKLTTYHWASYKG